MVDPGAASERLLAAVRTAHDPVAGLVAIAAATAWQPPGPSPTGPRVFVSYAHGNAQHEADVARLVSVLRGENIDARYDKQCTQPQDWAQWTIRQLRKAKAVLVIASDGYRRKADGRAAPGVGRGVAFEAASIREAFYDDPVAARRKYLPVLLPGSQIRDIPAFFGPTSTTRYQVDDVSPAGVAELVKVLAPAGFRWPPPGGVRRRGRRPG